MVDDVRARTAPRTVGRSAELDRIDEMVERLATGRGSVVVLTGPPGIGLTTLLLEAIARAGEAVADVRAVHVPSGLLTEDAGAALAAATASGRAAAVLAAASGTAGDVLRRAAAAGAMLGDATASSYLDDPGLVRTAVEVLTSLGGERPLLVTVDNLPLADGRLFAALTSLAAGVAPAPVMVVVTSHVLPRSSYEESPVGPLWVRRVPPLAPAECVGLVREATGRRVPRSVAATIGRRTGGVPGDLVAVCSQLEPDQLAGLAQLPDLLPGTPASTATYGSWWGAQPPPARTVLLCTAVAVTAWRSRIEDASGAAVADVLGPDGAPALREERGLVTASDPRLLSAVCALSRPDEIHAAQSALARSSPEGSIERCRDDVLGPRSVHAGDLGTLAASARDALERGELAAVSSLVRDVSRALAPAPVPGELLLLGGAAALYLGHAGQAADLLGSAVGEEPASLARFFPALLVAVSHRDGSVPHHLVDSCLSRLGGEWPRGGASVAALAADLSAAYGDGAAARRYRHHAASLLAATPAPTRDDADALSVLAAGRPALDVAGWHHETHRLAESIDGRDWARARESASALRSRLRRFPAPLLRARLATLSVRFHLALGEYRRAEEVAASAVEERLPLHVPFGGAGIAHLAQLAFLRGRRADAESWVDDLAELVQGLQDVPLHAAALHETLGLRAQLDGDDAAAVEHFSRAVRAGPTLVSPSSPLDLVRLRIRSAPEATGVQGDPDDPENLEQLLPAPALALLHAPAGALVERVASTAREARTTTAPVHEAQLLELAAERLGSLTEEQYALQARSEPGLPAGRDTYRSQLLRRARQLYTDRGGPARAEAVDRALAELEPPVPASHLRALTPDELTVARLVQRGASNKEVADALYLSVRSVELRLTHVYRKLGLRSRRELRSMTSLDEAVP